MRRMDGVDAKRVWIDDRNAIFRRGMVSCLSAEGFVVVGESSALIPEPALQQMDILVFDLDEVGLQRPLELARGVSARLVAIAGAGSEEALVDAIEAGLAGLLIRADVTPQALVSCLRAVASGNGSVSPRLLASLLDGPSWEAKRGRVARQLSSRELSVLQLLGEGGSTREIARDLCYSEKTVKNIVHDVLLKMDCRTRAHAVALATRQGLI